MSVLATAGPMESLEGRSSLWLSRKRSAGYTETHGTCDYTVPHWHAFNVPPCSVNQYENCAVSPGELWSWKPPFLELLEPGAPAGDSRYPLPNKVNCSGCPVPAPEKYTPSTSSSHWRWPQWSGTTCFTQDMAAKGTPAPPASQNEWGHQLLNLTGRCLWEGKVLDSRTSRFLIPGNKNWI